MTLNGHVVNGVIVLDEATPLPEGAAVGIVYPVPSTKEFASDGDKPVDLPLVRCREPGVVKLSNARIAEVLDAEDASAGH